MSSHSSHFTPHVPLVPHRKMLNRAIFLDRDGTINVEKEYLINPSDFELLPDVSNALQKLQNAGFLLVIVSNQSGVARGYFTESQVDELHQSMEKRLEPFGVTFDGIYFCPHHPTSGQGEYLCDCECRKGKPGMLLKAAKELQIDLSQSFMIGDKLADIQAGHAAGCKTFLVKTGYGKDFEMASMAYGSRVVDDLLAAADTIVTGEK